MLRHILDPPKRVNLMGRFVGVTYDVGGELVAVEFYPGSVPTFTFFSDTGHLYAYLPPHAFGHSSRQDLAELVDVECPASDPSVFTLPVDVGGFGRVGKTVLPWEKYVCSVDWAAENILVHCVTLYDGALAFMRNSRFQIGGRKWEPPDWKKTRHDWRLSNRDVCLVVRRGDKFLAVARDADATTFGLPAGKIDPGETPVEAAGRELREETGLGLGYATLLDEREWRGRYIFCFLAEAEGEPDDDVTLLARDEWPARWVDPHVLRAGEFGEYNETIFREYGSEIERG
jgi:8-oxo-dGTP pyrophosphatase MutT (NUDIX family)